MTTSPNPIDYALTEHAAARPGIGLGEVSELIGVSLPSLERHLARFVDAGELHVHVAGGHRGIYSGRCEH